MRVQRRNAVLIDLLLTVLHRIRELLRGNRRHKLRRESPSIVLLDAIQTMHAPIVWPAVFTRSLTYTNFRVTLVI